ncbi:MAG: PQQ-binding-like beta-propeller repeat protein [Anaerolineae bacterium]|nr:PQQ-binding-like beta-propeller repeat protein [Anaerolineae bacterium]
MVDQIDTQKFPGPPSPGGGSESVLQTNTVLQNRYRITGVLGMGGMGAVYQARDLHFPNVKRMVAVKEMLNTSTNPQIREATLRNFEREADILASLTHPSVPKIYDYFSIRDRAYLVMEYINGRDLEEIINKASDFIKVEIVYQWAIDLCDVLSYLHSHEPEPIVFRDVKPSNIMIDQHRHVRLIDFGIAKTFEIGQKGTMIGTEGYSPPEQYKGQASPQGDIYALGATLHHILTRRDPRLEPPFSFKDRPIRDYNGNVDPEFEAVIMRSLEYRPEDRYPSAMAMKSALEHVRPSPDSAPAVLGTAPIMHNSAGAVTAPVGAQAAKPSTAFFPSGGSEVIPLWTFRCEDEIRSSPAVVYGNLYVGCYDNGLYCIGANDGKFKWRYATEGGIASSPAVADGVVYFGSDDYALYAVDAQRGRILWSFHTEAPVRSSPRVALGHVFIGSDDGNLYAIRIDGGRRAWAMETGDPVRSTAYVTDDLVLFGCDSGDFYAVDLSGKLKWRYKARRGVISSPVVQENLVFFGSMDWHIYAIALDTGWNVWSYRTTKAIASSPVLDDSNVYIGSSDGYFYALDCKTGRDRWKFETEGQIATKAVVHQNAVYFGSGDGYVYSLDTKSGQLRWKFKTGGPVVSAPFVHEGVVYVCSLDHNVYALTA